MDKLDIGSAWLDGSNGGSQYYVGNLPVNKLQRLLYWLPVIWRDRDWDYNFIWPILRHKLAAMERAFDGPDAVACSAKQDAQKIRIARILCDRLIKDDYLDNALRQPELQWGKSDETWKSLSDGCIEFTGFVYVHAKTPAEIKQAKRDYLQAGRRADRQQIEDIRYLFAWMTRHIRNWWD